MKKPSYVLLMEYATCVADSWHT